MKNSVHASVTGLVALLMLGLVASEATARWVDASGDSVPRRAAEAGWEANGDPLYVCRASFQGGVHPGKVRRGFGGCNIPWGGREHTVFNHQVWVGDGYWDEAANGAIPMDAVRGGREANREPLYVCRAAFGNGVHPGKVRPAFGGCNIPYGGREHAVRRYEVLVD